MRMLMDKCLQIGELGQWYDRQRQSYEDNGTNKITENPNQYVENIADSNHKQKKLGTR